MSDDNPLTLDLKFGWPTSHHAMSNMLVLKANEDDVTFLNISCLGVLAKEDHLAAFWRDAFAISVAI